MYIFSIQDLLKLFESNSFLLYCVLLLLEVCSITAHQLQYYYIVTCNIDIPFGSGPLPPPSRPSVTQGTDTIETG